MEKTTLCNFFFEGTLSNFKINKINIQ